MSYNQNKFNTDLLLAKIEDNIEISKIRKSVVYTSFLYEEEQAIVLDFLNRNKVNYMFFGGYKEAQRKMLATFINSVDILQDDFPIVALEFTYKKEYNLSHRDFLGALMALGLKREVIGDILIDKGRTIVFIKSELQEYINTQIQKIGNVGVNINVAKNLDLPIIENTIEKIYTISSLRLDNIVSAILNISRDKSSKLIKSGFVNVNHIIKDNISYVLCEKNTITIRGKGKFFIEEIKGVSKKGKIKIIIKHYC